MNPEQLKRAGELNQSLVKLSTVLILSVRRMLTEHSLPPPYNVDGAPFPGMRQLFEWILAACDIDSILQLVEEGKANYFHRTTLYTTAHRLSHAAIATGLISGLSEAREWLEFEREYGAGVNEIGHHIIWPDA